MNDERYPVDIVFPMDLTNDIKEYRIPGDNENVVRINSRVPNGMDLKIATNIPVAGVTFRVESVHNFIEGYKRMIVLSPEPNNKYDKYAIAIHGTFEDEDGSKFSAHIGYVPKKLAKKLHNRDIAVQLKIIYLPTKNKGAGLRMDILEVSDLMKNLKGGIISEDIKYDGEPDYTPPPEFSDFNPPLNSQPLIIGDDEGSPWAHGSNWDA